MGTKHIRQLWLEVTQDEYELPLRVADTARALAQMCGTSVNNVVSTASHYKAGRHQNTKFRSVPYYEEDLDG